MRGLSGNWQTYRDGAIPNNAFVVMIFISHTHRDLEFAKETERLLSLKGYYVWLDDSKIPVGEEFVIAISDAFFSSKIFPPNR